MRGDLDLKKLVAHGGLGLFVSKRVRWCRVILVVYAVKKMAVAYSDHRKHFSLKKWLK